MSTAEKISEKALESAKSFLSGVFMGLRTLQIHDANNRAVENAVRTAYEASSALYAATGGFKIQFVDSTVFLNGQRVRFEGGMFQSVRVLENALRAKQVGGFAMSIPPSFEAIRTLITELAKDGDVEHARLESFSMGALGLQTFSDDASKVFIDRRILAVQSYAKLILALREHFRRVRRERAEGRSSTLRLRVVRIVQDLVEIVAERPDVLLRLSTNLSGAVAEELHGVNTALLVLAMGQAIGLDRRDLVDAAMGALFHHIGIPTPESRLDRPAIVSSAARMFADGGVSRSSLLRSIVVAHQRKRADGKAKFRDRGPHLFARMTAIASAYSQLVSGYGVGSAHRAPPLDALQTLSQDPSGRFDADLVDLLINVLRAFPVGCHVVLDTGEHGTVTTHLGNSRWDRPVVALKGDHPRNLDLMITEGAHFPYRIAATARHLGRQQEARASHSGTAPPSAARKEGEDIDELFKEFLAEDKKKKPRIDTSYSSKPGGEQD